MTHFVSTRSFGPQEISRREIAVLSRTHAKLPVVISRKLCAPALDFARVTFIRYTRAVSTPSPSAGSRVEQSLRRSSSTSTVRPLAALREGALQRGLARLLGSWIFWVLFLAVAFGWPIVRVARTAQPSFLPVLGVVSDFELVDQNGQPFGTAHLKGRVWLASNIQMATPAAADELASELGKIQHRVRNLGPAFHLVTVGTDPDVDTPARLLEFTSHRRVSPRIWSFLSGNPDSLRHAQQALGLRPGATVDSLPVEAPHPFTVMLVDTKMQVRGRYDLSDPSAIDVLLYHTGL